MVNTCKRRLRRTESGDCATPTERCNARRDESAMVNTCKQRLRRTASGDCPTPTESCNARQDEAAMLNTANGACDEWQAAIVQRRLNAVMLVGMSLQW
eukprot:CAMPEP_0203858852 /NCGR_PEP_ID=MMETSP0359-20131031/11510_1 /ASSEMBLY_ACC=CAM_ASM_000338 /TAXON_ID=268821 /ORGANISM="Scrippsiella Hangoei, Strain SHTV-5" /LENGTH=97 /DNA_ID=CAMNT_0050775681 /DNA_START=92 /DNA_END=386 /DNA_ORIENTATION=+